jgi:flagellar biosynthetic protein FlhB
VDEAQTEAATPRRIARARRLGDVPRSRDLPGAAALLATVAVLLWLGAESLAILRELLVRGLRAAADSNMPPEQMLRAAAVALSSVLLAPLVAAFAAALLAGFGQVGAFFSMVAVLPARERAGRGFALWSSERAVLAFWSTFKLLSLLLVMWLLLRNSVRGVFGLTFAPPSVVLQSSLRLLGGVALWLGASWLSVGVLDLVVQRVRHRQRLRMSARELREEQREAYGDPYVRARRRSAMMQARLRTGLQELGSSGLLLLDYRGRAVALGHAVEDGSDAAPRVWIKAQGELARRLHEDASLAGVRLAHDDALVRALYPLELSERVPPALYAQVAAHWVG